MKSKSPWQKQPSIFGGYYYIHLISHVVVSQMTKSKQWIVLKAGHSVPLGMRFSTEKAAMKFADTLPVNRA